MSFPSRGPAWGRTFIPLPGPPAQATLPADLAPHAARRQVRPRAAGAGHRHRSGQPLGQPWVGARALGTPSSSPLRGASLELRVRWRPSGRWARSGGGPGRASMTGPRFWDTGRGFMCQGPQAELGSSLPQALGPKAEGAELKIAEHLPWPARPRPWALPPSPCGDSCTPARQGLFWSTFSSDSSPGNSKTTPPGGWSWGWGTRGLREGEVLLPFGSEALIPHLSLPQALSPGLQDGGVSEVPSPNAPATPSSHPQAGVSAPPGHAVPSPLPHHRSLTSLFSPPSASPPPALLGQ